MGPIKVAIQGAQWAEQYAPATSTTEVVTGQGVEESLENDTEDDDPDVAHGEDKMDFTGRYERITLRAVEEPTKDAADQSLRARQLDAIRRVELALAATLAERESNKRAMIDSMVAAFDRLRSSS